MKDKYDLSRFVDVRTTDATVSDLVARFRKRRKEQKITQQRLADMSGVSLGSIRRFEQSGEISLNSLLILADKIGCLENFDRLFEKKKITDLNGENWND